MRQEVKAPFRYYVPYLLSGAAFVVLAVKPWSSDFHLTWADLLPFLAIVGFFGAFVAFILGVVTNMVITMNDEFLVVRDEYIALLAIVECTVLTDPPAELKKHTSYKIKTGNGMIFIVPGKVDSLVQVTLNTGQQIAFSAQYPDAIIQALAGRCVNLRK